MPAIFRHDAITLHEAADAASFESFMTGELIPYFSDRYDGPTRASIADIKGQSLLRKPGSGRSYLWITQWDGPADALRAASFEGARMIPMDGTEAILTKLATFGKRVAAKVFERVASVDAGTN
jgi:hypothetical protein